ncbi:hypothetical protein BC834DRAFT_892166, partial [Gloeopeniophorella convolvens]
LRDLVSWGAIRDDSYYPRVLSPMPSLSSSIVSVNSMLADESGKSGKSLTDNTEHRPLPGKVPIISLDPLPMPESEPKPLQSVPAETENVETMIWRRFLGDLDENAFRTDGKRARDQPERVGSESRAGERRREPEDEPLESTVRGPTRIGSASGSWIEKGGIRRWIPAEKRERVVIVNGDRTGEHDVRLCVKCASSRTERFERRPGSTEGRIWQKLD